MIANSSIKTEATGIATSDNWQHLFELTARIPELPQPHSGYVPGRKAHTPSPRLQRQPRMSPSTGTGPYISPHSQTGNKYYSTVRISTPQPHVTTRMNPPNVRQKLDAKVHTPHNSTDIKDKGWPWRVTARVRRLGAGTGGSGRWPWAGFLIWVLVTYLWSNNEISPICTLKMCALHCMCVIV